MPRKRSLDRETISRIAARTIVVPYVTKIGPLVDRAVFLETIASHRPERHPDLRREAAMLADGAREDLRHFNLQVEGVPVLVAEQPSIEDTRRALVAVVERFERALLSL